MAYADRIKVPYCAIIGEDEEAQGIVALKDMKTGEQVGLKAEDAAALMKEKLAAMSETAPVKL